MSARSRIGCVLVFATVSLGALGACGDDAGKSVAAPDVASQIKQQLTMAGRQVDSVTCPAPLPAEVGATITCTVVGGGATSGAKATVTTVNQGTANFNVEEVPAPAP